MTTADATAVALSALVVDSGNDNVDISAFMIVHLGLQAYGSIAMMRLVGTRVWFKVILTLSVIVGLCSRIFKVAIFNFTHLFFLFVYCDLIT